MCNLLFVIFLVFFPREVLSAARDGLLLWFNNVLPSLLPFIVAVNLLTALGFVRLISAWVKPFMRVVFNLPGAGGFALITGLISGYPMGAKTVADLWCRGEITTKEAQRLLAFCNNAGPLFIVGVVGVGLLGNSTAGYVLWAGHVVAALIVGVLTRRQGNDGYTQRVEERAHMTLVSPSPGKALGDAVKNAMEALLLVGGLIVFFSVVVRAIMVVAGDLPLAAGGAIAGIIEVTGGVKILADISSGDITPRSIGLIGGIIAFGGFSVHAQALHFTSGTGIKARVYIIYKAIGGVIAAIITGLIWSVLV